MRKIYQPGRSNVLSNNAMVATSQPLSSQEAINILKKVIEKYTLLDDEYGNVYDYNLVINKASSYNALGESFFALNANSNNDKYLDSTLFYYKKAFDETEKFIPKHENSLSFYHLRVATVLIKRKQYKRASC